MGSIEIAYLNMHVDKIWYYLECAQKKYPVKHHQIVTVCIMRITKHLDEAIKLTLTHEFPSDVMDRFLDVIPEIQRVEQMLTNELSSL